MKEQQDIYKTIADRERASRKAAEKLLEQKSLELYEKTIRIEKARQDVNLLNMHLVNVMSSAPDGIITCSKNLKILNMNVTASNQLKLSSDTVRGRSIEDFIPNIRHKIIEIKKRSFDIDEIEVVRDDKTKFIAEIRGRFSVRAQEKYFILFIHDITNRLAAKEEKRQMYLQIDETRRLEAIGALSAGIAHEINTPIQYIGDNLGFLNDAMCKIQKSYLNYINLLSNFSRYDDGGNIVREINEFNSNINLSELIGDVESSINESLEGINQVRDIIHLMKEFAHPGQTESDEVDINDVIRGVIRITNSRHKPVANVELDLCPSLPMLKGRRNQIRQVILNMVLNGLDAIEETGIVPGRLRIETRSEGRGLNIIISDTGHGVPPALVTKIFDPFFTTKPVGKGTGQGLALAKDFIVAGHQGTLRLIETEGFNTSFEIWLPLKSIEKNPKEKVYAA